MATKPTYCNPVNAKTIAKSTAYVVTAPILAIGSVACCGFCVTLSTLCRPFSGARTASAVSHPKYKTGELKFDRADIESDQKTWDKLIELSWNTLESSKSYFKYVQPFEVFEKTRINDKGESVSAGECDSCLTIDYNAPFRWRYCDDGYDSDCNVVDHRVDV